MAGVALLLDLLKRSEGFSAQSLHSHSLFSATVAASAAAASIAAGRPFASRVIFGDGGLFSIAYCDAGASAALNADYVPDLRSASKDTFYHDSIKYRTKEYPIQLKPLFSAFGLKALGVTSLRSFLLFYLPLLEPRPPVEDDDDFLQDVPEERPIDLVTPFQNSMKQIIREIVPPQFVLLDTAFQTSVVTTRRVLERLAVQYVSPRMAWKLLKDIPKSAKRKANRGMPTLLYFYTVSRTTFRGHLLGVAASWLVQIVIEIYRCFIRKSNNGNEEVDIGAKFGRFRKKVYGTTVKCSASLVFASIGAGIGALFHPSTGQWIGCALGDFAGPIIVVVCFEKLHMDI